MKTQYVINGYLAFSEQDNWENGCHGKTLQSFANENEFNLSANSLSELLEMVGKEFKTEQDCITLNSCDELGRIDVQVYQREPFLVGKPSVQTVEKFQRGEIDLWLTDYTMQVNVVHSEMDLQAIIDNEEKETNK